MRRAFSLLELQVALIVLGVALSGLLPLLVMQSRAQRRLDARLDPATTYHLGPSADAWARKLGAAAALSQAVPSPAPAPPVLDMDDGAAGYSEAGGGWASEAGGAYGVSARIHAAGTGAATASFAFTGLRPGWYQVWATWPAAAGRSATAQFSAWDGTTARGTFAVDQTQAPVGTMFGGRPWQLLGLVPLAGTTLEARLGIAAGGSVAADGVRLVEVRNTVTVAGVERTVTGEAVTATVGVAVVTP